MTKTRLMLLTSLLGGMVLMAGCKTLKGCLKPPLDADTQEKPLLRTPVGLDPPDNSTVLKVPPPPEVSAVQAARDTCLEEPPQIEVLPDPAPTAKEIKKAVRKQFKEEARKARAKKAAEKAAEKAAKKEAQKSADKEP